MTDLSHLESVIESAWEDRADVSAATHGDVRDAVETALALLDSGQARVASRGEDGVWITHQWLKKAVLLSFRLNDNQIMRAGDRGPTSHAPGVGPYWDKVPNKFGDWATVGSCAQIGKNVHLSGGAGIGGVLEPLQANPTIIEDGCFIGARAEVAEGVIVREGAVLAMGVYLSGSTKIVDRATGEVFRGEVPAYSVVVPGALPDPKGGPSLYCAVIVKRVDVQTRAKTGVNELLRD